MRWRLSLTPVLAGGLLISMLFGQLLAPGRALAERDIPALHLPMLTDLVRLAGEGFPHWNPWIHGGQPLVSNPHYAVFYLPVWICALLPVHHAIDLLVVLHAIWAFSGAWRLASRWGCSSAPATLAAIGFVGGGAFVSSPNLLNLFMGFAWVPWAMLWGDEALAAAPGRGWLSGGAKTALVLAAQILTGSPEMAFVSLLALACAGFEHLGAGWQRPIRLVPIGLVTLALAAAQLLPTLRHLSDSMRGRGLSQDLATMWSTPPVRLMEWFWPRIFGDPMLRDANLYFGYLGINQPIPLIVYIHCGILIVALAIGGLFDRGLPHRRTLLAMILLGIFLSLGRFNPMYSTILLKIPPFSVIRFPEKFLLLSTTGIALAAALAWQRLLASRESPSLPVGQRVSTLVAVSVLVASAFLYASPLLAPDLTVRLLEGATAEKTVWYEGSDGDALPPDVLTARATYLGRQTFISGTFWLAALLVLRLHMRRRVSPTLLTVLVLGLAMVDLAYYSRTVNRTVPVQLLEDPPPALRHLPPSVGRVFTDAILFGHREFLIPDLESEVPPSIRRFLQRLDPYAANIWGYGYALEPDPDLMVSRWAYHSLGVLNTYSGLQSEGFTPRVYRLLGAWNVAILVRTRSPEAQMEEKRRTGALPDPVRIVPNPEIMPRFRVVTEVSFETQMRTAIDRVSERDFQLTGFDAIVVPQRGIASETRHYHPGVEWLEVVDRGSELRFAYQTEDSAFLVAAITMDRDWRAQVDGAATPIYPTALGQMGIELPAGRHQLVMRHRNPVVLPGLAISLLAAAACLLALRPHTMRHGA